MKASIRFREEQKPLLRAKIPLNVLNLPFQAGVVAGESKELSLNLSTFLDSGPSLRFSYRPNDSKNPFSFIFKTGIGHFGSPTNSPLTMSAEFNLMATQNPIFFIHFKPNFGDFSLKKSHSSDLFKGIGEKINGGEEAFVSNGYFQGTGFFPATPESKEAAGLVVSGLMKGVKLGARTHMPLRDLALVNFRWGLRLPMQEAAVANDMDAVVVGRRCGDRAGAFRLPLLVMNKIGIEHVTRPKPKEGKVGPHDKLVEACLDVKKQLEAIQAENEQLGKALSELRLDITARKLDLLPENYRSKYSGGVVERRRANGDKKFSEAFGTEDGSKVV